MGGGGGGGRARRWGGRDVLAAGQWVRWGRGFGGWRRWGEADQRLVDVGPGRCVRGRVQLCFRALRRQGLQLLHGGWRHKVHGKVDRKAWEGCIQ